MAVPNGLVHVRHYVQTDDSVPRLFDAYYAGAPDLDPFDLFGITADIALETRNSMATAMLAWLAEDSRYLGCTVHFKSSNVVGVAKQINNVGEEGGLDGDTCPDYVSAVARRYTEVNGPSGRGRVFLPAVAEINTDTSRLNTDGQEALDGIILAMSAPIEAGPGDFNESASALWIRNNNSVQNVLQWYPVEELVTQRRRRLRPLQ